MGLNWVSVRQNMMWWTLVTGFLIMLLVGFTDMRDKAAAFDVGFRFLRFGSIFAIWPVLDGF